MSVYYNEHDPFAAAWLSELIKAGEIPDGFVDTRDIQNVAAADLDGYAQCHFFAGIGGWALALKLAGWGDRPVWTGSCPCQPFSAAGKQKGGGDDRHLWPHWARLIRECRPATIVGEQVESAIAHGWLDAVFDDLESEGYACGAVDLPAASVGAPHRRQRVWFVAHAEGGATHRDGSDSSTSSGQENVGRSVGHSLLPRLVADAARERRTGERLLLRPEEAGWHSSEVPEVARSGRTGELAQSERVGWRWRRDGDPTGNYGPLQVERRGESFWSDCTWLPCRDGKWRAVEPGTFPLAHGISGRMGRLRGYGNAIVPQVAAEVLSAFLSLEES